MTRDRITLVEAAVLVAVLTLSGTCPAQNERVFPEPEPSGIQPDDQGAGMDYGLTAGEYWFDLWSEFSPSGELGDGDVETWRTGAELGAMYPLGPRDRLWIQFRSEYTNSDFKNIDEFVPDGDLYNSLLEYTLSVTSMTAISDRWSLLLRASGTSAGEAHADFDETVTFRGVVGAAYTINSNLQIGLAAAMGTRLEEDTAFVPLPLIDLQYEIDEQWRVELRSFTGLKVTYAPAPALDLSLRGTWEYTEYRMDHDGPFAGGVFRELRVPVMREADWKLHPQFVLTGSVGLNLLREWEFDDDNGNKFFSTSVNNDMVLGLGLTYRF